MSLVFLSSFILYLIILAAVGVLASCRQKNASDFMVGGRSLNYWVTAIATHATDMSTWLFMAFPGLVYREGMFACWVAMGLLVGMYLTWRLIAPKLRLATEKYDSPTLSSYFEKRFNDPTGHIRLLSAIIAVFFFTFYVAAGIVGLGRTVEITFGLNYHLAIIIGTIVVAGYTLLGGFLAVAWNDFLQGVFVLFILAVVPAVAYMTTGGVSSIIDIIGQQEISLSLLPDYSWGSIFSALSVSVGWGIGYFGLPHVLVNFMGIEHAEELKKSRRLGMAWQFVTLTSALLVGLIGIAYFAKTGVADSEFIFVIMAKGLFSPFFAGLVLCGILAAAITTMDSQILVSASMIAEDFYKRFYDRAVSPEKLLQVSRLGGLFVTICAFAIAWSSNSSIIDLVLDAWSGLGGAFGPVLIASFYFPIKVTRQGALAGIVVGGLVAGLWKFVNIPILLPLIPAYMLSFLAVYTVSKITGSWSEKLQ